ncbi:hypothetical protein [Brevibacterium casei]|uniref:hypothetical protein n=1 Tax=Brevibacterium casei TaxID=33889 RepID=UPI00223B996E|nr:hypothetical protein [Brevibacterium casei]MCT1550410.1 hypothetical protein [Brevibacterium casei]MCT1559748.1 hypothetical protein [Brevibacterium casei]MCT2208422.1 hypothetical protein [Brevibacterium casei]
MLSLWMAIQLIVVVLSADLDAVLPQSPAHLLVLLGAALLSPAAAWVSSALVRVLSLAPHGPWMRREPGEVRDVLLPEAPGTPGTALARAPSSVLRAHA